MSSIDGFQSIELAFAPSILFLLFSNILFQMLPNSTLFYSAGDKSPFLGSNLPSLITRRKPARKTHQTYKKNCLQIAYIFQNRRNNTFFLQKRKSFFSPACFILLPPRKLFGPRPLLSGGWIVGLDWLSENVHRKKGRNSTQAKIFSCFYCFSLFSCVWQSSVFGGK